MYGIESTWTDARIDILKTLWVQGLSASRIAAELGEVSRSSVLGKVHRLKLAKRANITQSSAEQKPRVHKRQRFREVPPMPVDIPPAEATAQATFPERPGQVTLMDLTPDTCRWPLWTDAQPEQLFCGASGADLENKLPYCRFHSRMAYQRRSA